MTACDLDTAVPDWVIDHPETLAVFQKLGMDYSCGGKSLAYACRERGLDAKQVLEELHRCLSGMPFPQVNSSPSRRSAMAIPHANPGEVIDVSPLGSALASTKSSTLLKSGQIEVVRLVMVAGKEIAEHQAPGELTVHCLEGKIEFTALGQTHELTAGRMLFLHAGEPHAVKCLENASILLTILLKP